MRRLRTQEILGIFFVLLGMLFFLVNNRLLPFGWEAVWPIFLLLVGLFLLRVYGARRKARQLFLGSLLTQFGVFFFLFSTTIIDWDVMETLWPAFPLMIGVSMLAVSGVIEHGAPAVVFGLFLTIFAIVAFMAETGIISSRVSQPLLRIWPLVLVGAGALIFLRARRDGQVGAPRKDDGPASAPTDAGEPPSESQD